MHVSAWRTMLCAVRQKKCNKEGKEPKALLELPPSFFELELFSFFIYFFLSSSLSRLVSVSSSSSEHGCALQL